MPTKALHPPSCPNLQYGILILASSTHPLAISLPLPHHESQRDQTSRSHEGTDGEDATKWSGTWTMVYDTLFMTNDCTSSDRGRLGDHSADEAVPVSPRMRTRLPTRPLPRPKSFLRPCWTTCPPSTSRHRLPPPPTPSRLPPWMPTPAAVSMWARGKSGLSCCTCIRLVAAHASCSSRHSMCLSMRHAAHAHATSCEDFVASMPPSYSDHRMRLSVSTKACGVTPTSLCSDHARKATPLRPRSPGQSPGGGGSPHRPAQHRGLIGRRGSGQRWVGSYSAAVP